MSQLIDNKLHSEDTATFKQSVDYRYNIRGWLTSMNGAELGSNAKNSDTGLPKDLFGIDLIYNETVSGLSNTVANMYSPTLSRLRVIFLILSVFLGLGYWSFVPFGDYLIVLYLLAVMQLAAIGNEIGMLFLGRRQAATYLVIIFSVLVLALTVYILIMNHLLRVGTPVKY